MKFFIDKTWVCEHLGKAHMRDWLIEQCVPHPAIVHNKLLKSGCELTRVGIMFLESHAVIIFAADKAFNGKPWLSFTIWEFYRVGTDEDDLFWWVMIVELLSPPLCLIL